MEKKLPGVIPVSAPAADLQSSSTFTSTLSNMIFREGQYYSQASFDYIGSWGLSLDCIKQSIMKRKIRLVAKISEYWSIDVKIEALYPVLARADLSMLSRGQSEARQLGKNLRQILVGCLQIRWKIKQFIIFICHFLLRPQQKPDGWWKESKK